MTDLEESENSGSPKSHSKKRMRRAPKPARRDTEVPIHDRTVVLESREQLRNIEEHMVPHGVVHTAELSAKNTAFFFVSRYLVSLDGQHFVGVNTDPSGWTPDEAADAVAGVGTCIRPLTFSPEFLRRCIELGGGWLKFGVTQHEYEEEKKSR